MGFLMTIYDHGAWTSYVPAVWPEGLPINIIFVKNDVTGEDWYTYVHDGNLSHESVKLVCFNENGDWIVRIATVDGSRLFPEGRRVIELYDGDIDNPQSTYEGMRYDPASNSLVEAAPVVIVPASATKLGLKRALSELGAWAQAKAFIAADADTQEEWDLAIEIKRTDPLTTKLIVAMSLTPAQVDHILIRAKELTA
jgi:hypothetical protein